MALVHQATLTIMTAIGESKAAQSLTIESIKQRKYFRVVEAITEVEDFGSRKKSMKWTPLSQCVTIEVAVERKSELAPSAPAGVWRLLDPEGEQ